MNKLTFAIAIASFTCAFCQPSYAGTPADLRAACTKNPEHSICQKLAEKKAQAKARKAAKIDDQIAEIQGTKKGGN